MSSIEGWKTGQLGCIAELVMGQSPDSKYYSEEEVGMPFLQGCAEFQQRHPKHVQYCSQPKKIAPEGSILFSVRAPVGKLNIADRGYIIGRGLAGISSTFVDQNYLEHYLKFEESKFRNASQGSTFEAINSIELTNWPINYPERKTEQTKIAEVLSTVDRAIEQTEALIAKQQRIKTGLMQDLLTKGIDEYGNLRSEATHKFKDSPLGRIPVEWDVIELGDISEFVTSGSRGWAKYYGEEGAIFLRIGNLTRKHINLRFEDLVHVNPPKSSEGKRTAVKAGDLLISITADLGIIGVIPNNFDEAYVNQHISLVRLIDKVDPRFIGWYLSSVHGKRQFEKVNESGAKAGLNLPTIRKLLVTIFDKSEQKVCSSLLDFSALAEAELSEQLTKLRSLKTALMQDLLTGKRRVTPLLEKT